MKPGWVYLLRTGWHYKIGKTKNVRQRVADLQTASPYLIELVCAVYTENMDRQEQWFHRTYAEYRTNGEWFEFPPEMVEEVHSIMIDDEDILIGDAGDPRNYIQIMDSDYRVRSILKTAIYGMHFPNEAVAEGAFMFTEHCECWKDQDWYDSQCNRCGGIGWLVYAGDDPKVIGYECPAPREHLRKATEQERQAHDSYIEWLMTQEEMDE
jgi:hypothetical protein